MKNTMKKVLPVMLMAAAVAVCGTLTSCGGDRQLGTKRGNGEMYERYQSNRGSKVKSNIKVKGTNRTNGHTTRSY